MRGVGRLAGRGPAGNPIRNHTHTRIASRGFALRDGSDGEFDPGSGSTLAACLTHASRAGTPFGVCQRRTGEERVIDLPRSGGQPRETGADTAYVRSLVGRSSKAARRFGRGLRPIGLLAG